MSPKKSRSRRKVQFSLEQAEDGGMSLHVDVPPEAEGADNMHLNPAWQWLSKLEAKVVKLLSCSDWLSREQIAEKLQEQPDGKIAGILTGLAERGVLESLPRKGYHIAIPSDAKPEEYRAAMLAWLAGRAVPDCD